jgi:hypothetical protein
LAYSIEEKEIKEMDEDEMETLKDAYQDNFLNIERLLESSSLNTPYKSDGMVWI